MPRVPIRSEVAGRVWKLEAAVGQRLAADDTVMVLESMKMEIPVVATAGGTVVEVLVKVEDAVQEDQVVAVIET